MSASTPSSVPSEPTDYEALVRLADALEARYQAHPHRAVLRFGQWVMNECHPLETNPALFYCEAPQRARALMLTHWAAGWLDVRCAQRYAFGEAA